ncbi:MAG: metallophosphoesterase [Nanoarchaeota archaeon]|nr:metallophosphoesterase [Nanoarchaeota archaeon]
MKFLVIGDFHGEFPKKFKDLIKKEKIDLVISNGDYLPFAYRKLWFKHCFDKDLGLWEFIGKQKYKQLIKGDLRKGEGVLKKMNKLPVPVVTVLGNVDYPDPDDVADLKQIKKSKDNWDFDENRKDYFLGLIKNYRNVHLVNYSWVKIKNYIFVGMRGHSFPGQVKSKSFKKHKHILDQIFRKLRKQNKGRKLIFISHNVPYNTKLDKISMKAHESVRGEHYGSKLTRKVIDKWQPVLAIGGHIHEGRGIQKIGRTICVNPGSMHDRQYAIAEINEVNGKIKVKFGVKK